MFKLPCESNNISVKEEDFASWYFDVLIQGDLIDDYDALDGHKGFYIMKPWSYKIWENIQKWLNQQLEELGVENVYFPQFISSEQVGREKTHMDAFSPETSWVTQAGNHELNPPIAIRTTSEASIYPYFSKWIKRPCDLPLKLNQWCNIVRWEFKTPQPFIRQREFLWQEGHTAHLQRAEADKEVYQILELYRRVYEELLAVPVTKGYKAEKEKFAGGLLTTSIETLVPGSGRGIQCATSHSLGQKFSDQKAFDIFVEDTLAVGDDQQRREKIYVWQNSWGLSTRSIGVMVMIHGDDLGLVLPPCVAPLQVILIPSVDTGEAASDTCTELVEILKGAGVAVRADLRNFSSQKKHQEWERKGVPLRLKAGEDDALRFVRRDTGESGILLRADVVNTVLPLLEVIQSDMLNHAKEIYSSRLREVRRWEDLIPTLDEKCVAVLPWCEDERCEKDIMKRTAEYGLDTSKVQRGGLLAGAKSLAIPFDQSAFSKIEPGKTMCGVCGKPAKRWTLFGRYY